MPDPSTSGSPRADSRGGWAEQLRPRLATLRLSPTREAEIVEELSQHLDQRFDELREGGNSEHDARRLAMDELLDGDALARHMRSLRQAHAPPPPTPGVPGGWSAAELWQDLRYAVRMLGRQPGFAAVVVLTIALGIGANSAIFALVDATLLRPLPFGEPERLVMVSERSAASARGPVSPRNLLDWNERNRTFELIAAYIPSVGGMVMAGADGLAEDVPRQWVTAGFFDVLGVRPIVGRTFLPEDDARRANAVVLSERFWRARLGADPEIAGRDIRLDGVPYTVLGVVPRDFELLGGTSVWGLLPIQGAPPATRSQYMFRAIGRLRPGVPLDAANADMAAVADGLAQEFPNTNKGRGVALVPLHDALIGSELRYTSLLFVGVVGFVLLICCANVANLLLARATVRTRELAIRSALGAGRSRVMRQLLTESLVLSLLGGALGVAVGAAILSVAPSLVPQGLLPAAVTLTFNLRVAAILRRGRAVRRTAVRPRAVVARHRFPAGAGDGLGGTDRHGPRRSTSVAARRRGGCNGGPAALRRRAAAADAPRDRERRPRLPRAGRAHDGRRPARRAIPDPAVPAPVLRRCRAGNHGRAGRQQRGVGEHAAAGRFPRRGSPSSTWSATPPVDESRRPTADFQIVSPAYFRTLELPLVAGRGFDEHDTRDSGRVCIVNEAFVRNHLQGRSPIGLRIATRSTMFTQTPPVVREIVGVARQVKGRPEETDDLVQIYVPMAQNAVDDIFMLVAPQSGDATALAGSIRAAIGRVDKAQLVSLRFVRTLEDVAWEATARHRFRAVLVTTFAGLALLLAMVGVFGVLAYTVQQRVRDFGVRRALGATTGDVFRLVVGDAARVIAAGAVIGLVLSAAFSRLLATMLYGVQPLDPATFAFVTIALGLTAVVAVAGPAWRATRIDPAIALRGE